MTGDAAGAGSHTVGQGTGVPAAFAEKIRTLLGTETADFLSALTEERSGLRVNTLKLSPEAFAAISHFPLRPLEFPAEGFLVGEGERPGRHPFHAAGLYYLQDPAAMAVAPLLDVTPGMRVLDIAAAPGGKATHLAAHLAGEGLLVANDPHHGRARELASNLERLGVRNAVVTTESVERLAKHFGGWFDRVLLDAPCSGEAMFCKSAAASSSWSQAAVEGCARRQLELLDSAAGLVRPGGLLLYSTCTFSPEEDEEVIARFLTSTRELRLVEPPAIPGAARGEPGWVAPELSTEELERCLRFWPHRRPGAGHFVALLERTDRAEGETLLAAATATASPGERALLQRFAEESLRGGTSSGGALVTRGVELFRLPDGAPHLGRLRVLRPGLHLGTLHRDRLEPAHALALGCRAEEAVRVLDLQPEETARYLRGETLRSAGERGWLLVTVEGFPLGWGKRVGDTVKNHYPRGLRRPR